MFTPPKHGTCHVSRVMCHLSPVTCHVSPVTRNFFFTLKKLDKVEGVKRIRNYMQARRPAVPLRATVHEALLDKGIQPHLERRSVLLYQITRSHPWQEEDQQADFDHSNRPAGSYWLWGTDHDSISGCHL